MKNSVKFTALILSLGCALPSMAKSLQSYETDKNQSAQQDSRKLSADILTVLGMNNADLSPIAVPGAEQGKARRSNSSIVIKRLMEKGIRTLIDEERYGHPLVFTPSSTFTVDEAADAKIQYQLDICHKVYPKAVGDKKDGTLDSIMDRLHDMAAEPSEHKESVVLGDVSGIKALLASAGGSTKTGSIESVLGQLTGLEIVDGSIASLRFQNGSSDATMVSLSMLATYLSDEDDAFIAMMNCLYTEAHTKTQIADEEIAAYSDLSGPIDSVRTFFNSDRKEELSKIDIGLQRYNKDYYGKVDAYLAPRLEHARQINGMLKTLDSASLRSLLFVMLKAQAKEIPSGSEMIDLNNSTGDLINAALAKNDQATAEQVRIDSNYFSEIQLQLSRLKDTLTEKRALKIQTQHIIKDEIGGMKK